MSCLPLRPVKNRLKMRSNFCFLNYASGLLFFAYTFFPCSTIHAQNKSVTDTIEYIIKNKKVNEQVGNDLKELGNYYLDIHELDNARLAVSKLIEFSTENKYEIGIYDAYALSGSIALTTNDKAKAQNISQEWLALATKNNNDNGMNGAIYLSVKILYMQGKMDSVIAVSKAVLDAKRDTYDSVNLPKFNAILGNVYYQQGDFLKSNEYYLKSLSIAEKTNNEPLQSACIGNLGIINKELKNYREALKYYNKALALRIKNNQLQDVAGSYVGMATCYENLQLKDSAVFLYTKALALFTRLESKENIALVHNNLGQLMVEMNQLDSGMHHLQSAKKYFSTVADSINIAYNAWALGNAWKNIAKAKNNHSYFGQALKEMLLSKTLAELKGMEDLKIKSYKSLSELYEETGNEAQAFQFLKKYTAMNDSFRSQSYTNQIAEMQTKYETEKKENEITKLNSEKLLDAEKISRQKTLNYSLLAIASLILVSGFSILKNVQKKRAAEKQVAILERQNAIENMRTKIAGDVHDDMGANLTRLGLNAQQLLMSPSIPGKEKELAEKISLQSKEVISGMREIIWASNPANDNLKSMLGFMRQYIDRFFDGVNIRAVVNFPQDVGEVILHPEVRRNLFLILKESLNNAMKYSGTDKIDIDFTNENENFNFEIKDYGKGMDDTSKDDFSNGLRNIEMRAAKIQSLFKLITAPGKGVQIAISGKLY
jgi:signal transduction histidine kinase